jgi:hypothetical protein
MSRIDRIKEALAWLKVVFVALVAVDVWTAVVCTTAVIIGVNYAAYQRITELEKL